MKTILFKFLAVFLLEISFVIAIVNNSFAGPIMIPADNPITPAKTELGKKLFFEPRLSRTGTVSCASCHNVMYGGDDGRPTSFGVEGQLGGRNAPTVWNAAFQSVLFWDGRAANLEQQAVGPLTNPIEMGMSSQSAVIDVVKSIPGYVLEFERAFGENSVNIDNLAKAIATYERSLVTTNSPYDKFMAGDKTQLSEAAQQGLQRFKTIGCAGCHSGNNLSGPNLGSGIGNYRLFPTYPNSDLEKKYNFTKDSGRFQITKNEKDRNLFRVPTLRNIAMTAPYFHNGSVNSLGEAVKIMAKLQLDLDLVDSEIAEIVSFLETLSGEFPRQEMPRLPILSGTTPLSLNK